MKTRRDRKKEHIDLFLKTNYQQKTLFDDIYLEHNAIPELNFEEIDTNTTFLGKKIDYPIMINAITGGTDFSREINRHLSDIAYKFNIPIAVGSQTIGLHDGDSVESFRVVRDIVKDGVVIANLSANVNVDEVKMAIDMIEADAIQLHVNVAQELVMKEGDRQFRGILDNIKNIAKNVNVPVIVKEVGCGISRDVALRLYNVGVRYIDISGVGGTNFIEIEGKRSGGKDYSDLYSWGIPTALSLIQCVDLKDDLNIISSGGIHDSQDVIKSLCIGANMVGISGEILRRLLDEGYNSAHKYIEELTHKLKITMLLLGRKDIDELNSVPYKLKGELKELIY